MIGAAARLREHADWMKDQWHERHECVRGLAGVYHEQAYLEGAEDQREVDRIAAFGAIRRAAEVAREYDRIYREAFASCDCSTYSVTPDGDDVRRAIRAAIGSEKA